MTKTEQALVIAVSGLIVLMAVNFIGDNNFRESQSIITDHLIELQSNTNVLTEALSTVVLNLNEKMDIVLDELFDKVWEDLNQT